MRLLLHHIAYAFVGLLTLSLGGLLFATPYLLRMGLDLHPVGLLLLGLAMAAVITPIYGTIQFLRGAYRRAWVSTGIVLAIVVVSLGVSALIA